MRIKTQSLILILGILLVPTTFGAAFLAMERAIEAARMDDFLRTMRQHKNATSLEEALGQIMAKSPRDFRFAVIDSRGRVAFSSIGELPLGSSLNEGLENASKEGQSSDRMMMLGFQLELPEPYYLVASIPKREFIPAEKFSSYLRLGALTLGILLAFTVAMSILILRSITRSVISLDVETRKLAAGELEHPIAVAGNNEIASLSHSLNLLREEILEDRARRARFIMGISHDLKTPLALIKGYAEAIEDNRESAELSSYLSIIQLKADQLEGMIEDLIDFVRVNTGEWSRGLRPVALGAFLERLVNRLEADASLLKRRVRSDIRLPAEVVVKMDERLAVRALENLVNNAIRYAGEGATITLKAESVDKGLRVSVSDDGPGIAAEDLPFIFEPFYRGSSSRREEGLGLGLAIVKSIVESHGWSIEASSSEGRDNRRLTTFSLFIPSA
jgi:signal transduction histidine kinase